MSKKFFYTSLLLATVSTHSALASFNADNAYSEKMDEVRKGFYKQTQDPFRSPEHLVAGKKMLCHSSFGRSDIAWNNLVGQEETEDDIKKQGINTKYGSWAFYDLPRTVWMKIDEESFSNLKNLRIESTNITSLEPLTARNFPALRILHVVVGSDSPDARWLSRIHAPELRKISVVIDRGSDQNMTYPDFARKMQNVRKGSFVNSNTRFSFVQEDQHHPDNQKVLETGFAHRYRNPYGDVQDWTVVSYNNPLSNSNPRPFGSRLEQNGMNQVSELPPFIYLKGGRYSKIRGQNMHGMLMGGYEGPDSRAYNGHFGQPRREGALTPGQEAHYYGSEE